METKLVEMMMSLLILAGLGLLALWLVDGSRAHQNINGRQTC